MMRYSISGQHKMHKYCHEMGWADVLLWGVVGDDGGVKEVAISSASCSGDFFRAEMKVSTLRGG